MKRRLFQLAVFLLLGAALNVAIAWGCALGSKRYLSTMHSHPAWRTKRVVEHEGWMLHTQARIGTLRAMARRPYTDSAATKVPAGSFPRWCSIRELPALRPASWVTEGVWEIQSDWAYGWPCVSMWHQVSDHTRLWPGSSSAYLWGRHLPIKIVWFGFVVNSLFYAGVLCLLLYGSFTLRRHTRRKRGLCLACGYDLRHAEHDACPECGGLLPQP
ncbi:MAG: hypothetical protein IH830_07150 [Planctomycetes bacterium]|nr:hypothetical protein [Planctomycetota bacterium]